ncbi:hypothetical protein EJB05_45407, partial [Eragrostis curvula]
LDVKNFHCPQLRQLGLDGAIISDSCLCNMVAGSPVLECLLLKNCIGFCSIRINSPSLISIGFSYRGVPSAELIIEDAPLLQRLLQLERCGPLQNLCTVSFAVEMCSVRFLAVEVYTSIDMIIDMLRCFPCLEKLYIKLSGGTYHWHKHRNHVKCLDNNLRTVVLKGYRAKRSNVKLVTFFVLNAKMLEQMRFEATGFKYKNCKKIARHHRLLQLEKRVLSARFHFTVDRCLQNLPHIKHVHDLSKANPFECTRIPEGWVCNMIAGSPVLEFLLLNRVRGFTSMRINSPSLKLCAVSFATEICSVKVLAIIVQASESMDMIIGLLRCFPCLEKLYIQLSSVLRDKKHWHKLQNHVKCVDNSLRTVVLKGYRGTKSHVKLVNFLVLNAKMLEVMRLEATGFIHENSRKFIAEHRRLRQLEKRTLRSARIHFTIGTCEQDIIHIKHVHDLSKANPFECMC